MVLFIYIRICLKNDEDGLINGYRNTKSSPYVYFIYLLKCNNWYWMLLIVMVNFVTRKKEAENEKNGMSWPAREASKSHETCNHPDLKPPHDFADKQHTLQ